jgi:hypothetical protein
MARYTTTVESAAALPGAGATGASGTTSCFLNLPAAAGNGYRLRRLIMGIRNGSTATTAGVQASIAIARVTVAGTATTTLAARALDPAAPSTAIVPASAWSTTGPTFTAAPYLYEVTFSYQGGADISFEFSEELIVAAGTANGLAFINQGATLSASHVVAATVEWEE